MLQWLFYQYCSTLSDILKMEQYQCFEQSSLPIQKDVSTYCKHCPRNALCREWIRKCYEPLWQLCYAISISSRRKTERKHHSRLQMDHSSTTKWRTARSSGSFELMRMTRGQVCVRSDLLYLSLSWDDDFAISTRLGNKHTGKLH